jgi:hypothetical protein
MASFPPPDVSETPGPLPLAVIDVRHPECRKRKEIRSHTNESGFRFTLKEGKKPRREERGNTCLKVVL